MGFRKTVYYSHLKHSSRGSPHDGVVAAGNGPHAMWISPFWAQLYGADTAATPPPTEPSG
jgi:hypothetical protein